jgi:ribosomal protein S18 acetylase RimI-like enzyme
LRRIPVNDEAPPEVKRPATARKRGSSGAAEVDQDAPTTDELAAIERGLVELPKYSGAEVNDRADLGVVLSLLRGRGPGYNFASCMRWGKRDVTERLAGVGRAMSDFGEWPALAVVDGVSTPPDLGGRLADAGWVQTETERLMWTRVPPGVPHLDPSLRLEAVTPRTAAVYERVERDIFGLPADFASQRTAALSYSLSAGWLRTYLVHLNGQPVATTRLATGDGVASIFGVGVVPEQRRRGLGTLVTAVATRAGLAAGNKLVWLSVNELNDPALRIYQRLGYQPSARWSRWVISAI